MPLNQNKLQDQRFWKKWRDSGAVGTLSFNQQKHPELQEGEVYLTNSDSSGFCDIGWKSKRAGKIPLDRLGRPISSLAWSGAFPVFVKAKELAVAGVVIKHKSESVAYFPAM